MPTQWINRTFQPILTGPAEHLRLFPVWLLIGPRQVGKSSLLHKCAAGHAYVNLDDLGTGNAPIGTRPCSCANLSRRS